jgi:catechol 2,3-dioxygenase-like lactoylglutathione lyase family enzyme
VESVCQLPVGSSPARTSLHSPLPERAAIASFLFGSKLLQPSREGSMVRPQFGFVLEYVKDIEAAKRFYAEVLGVQMERYHPTFIQFTHFAIANDESMTGNRDPELYWLVDDARRFRGAPGARRCIYASQANALRQGVRHQESGRSALLRAGARARPTKPGRPMTWAPFIASRKASSSPGSRCQVY